MKKLLAASAAALFALTAGPLAAGPALADPAQRWRHVGDGDGIMGFVDLASVSRSGNLARAQVLIVSDRSRVTADEPMAYGVTSLEIDCVAKTDHMTYGHIFNLQGGTLGEGAMNSEMQAEDFSDPETVKLYSIICQGGAAPAGPDFASVNAAVDWAHAQRP